MKKTIILLAFFSLATPAFAMTQLQVNAIIQFLTAFNADPSVISAVQADLQATVSSTTPAVVSTSTPPVISSPKIIVTPSTVYVPAAPQPDLQPVTQQAQTAPSNPTLGAVQPSLPPVVSPPSKARIDITLNYVRSPDYTIDHTVFDLFVYDETGTVRDDEVLSVSTDDPNGFSRPGGYTDGQSPTVMQIDIKGTGTVCTTGELNSKYVYTPCYPILPQGHGTSSFTFSVPSLNVSTTTEVTY